MNCFKKCIFPSLVITLILAVFYFYVLKVALLVPILHIDGAFQTASALFRLMEGHLPGRDFYPYLGAGLNYFIYPFFILFGASLKSSMIASAFVVLTTMWLKISAMLYLFLRTKKLLFCLILGAVITTSCLLGHFFFVLSKLNIVDNFQDLFNILSKPGVSLRPLRAFMPYLLILLSYRWIMKPMWKNLDALVLGAIAGLSVIWSNDYAYTSALLFVLLCCSCLFFKSQNNKFKLAAILVVSAVLSSIFYLLLLTGGHALSLLKYNFLDVRSDQWWYFVPYVEPYRFFDFGDFWALLSSNSMIFLISTLLVLLGVAIRYKSERLMMVAYLGGATLAGGLLACVGGQLLEMYFYDVYLWLHLVYYFALAGLAIWLMRKYVKITYRKYMKRAITCLLILYIAFAGYRFRNSYMQEKDRIATSSADYYYVEKLEAHVDKEWQPYFEFIQQNSGKRILEDYWGLFSVYKGDMGVAKVDSVIHALGRQRADFVRHLQEVDLVTTTAFSLSPYTAWSISANYDFYRELFSSWKPIYKSPRSVVWARSSDSYIKEFVAASVVNDAQAIRIDCKEAGYFDVLLETELNTESRTIILFDNQLNYAFYSDGKIALNPSNDKHRTVVYASPDACQFSLSKLGGDGKPGKIKTVSVRRIEHIADEVLPRCHPRDAPFEVN